MGGFFPYSSMAFKGSIPAKKGKVAASTAITTGDPLTIDADGYMDLMAKAGQCDGVAAESIASGVAGRIFAYYPCDLTYKVKTETTAPAQTDVGELCDLKTATTGNYTINVGASTSDDFFVEGIVEKRPGNVGVTLAIGDEVYGHFNDTNKNI